MRWANLLECTQNYLTESGDYCSSLLFFRYFHCIILTNMKKIFLLSTLVAAVFILSNCGPSKKATAAKEAVAAVPAKTTFDGNMQTLIMAYCSPCHIPAKGGNKKPYDNYANTKADIDSIIRRIELNPTDRGFMPFKKEKLSADVIAVFKKFKEDGALEN